ncbi:histidinol-phosphate transaminase [Desulfurivibrio alkaliphilus]|uniref:Histidinol-phosphate aminotransferase n=1 Tax=Desulfurivibrio alkaliphilus (strain DSM 19089 / UNIQEM U267 / AHT2) TaxID=589865 RepID=D6Z1J7_DESAT|nr:histidinol-phosphate transaminase [Desulfurivibrio alkaliphilus]ADH87331.1 histidinol-phosphate aminotransferase [Desulfurivibrio alkaliphilus AHT 2]
MTIKVAAHIAELVPYPPGKPIEELEREYGISGSIKLASNENGLGPSPRAVKAIAESLSNLHRYPDGSCYYLARALARRLEVDPRRLVFGNGSNEIIGLLAAAFLGPGDEVITSHPTFLVYQNVVQAQGGVNRVVPLLDMRHDLEAMAAQINEQTRMIFLDNPNNPTGTVFTAAEFEDFLSRVPRRVIVVLDEAYVDFVEPELRLDARQYLDGQVPVVALRTFSKAYGLAGLRVGYGLMHEELAAYLHRVRQPFNVNSPAQIGALAALEDEEHYRLTLETTRREKARLRQAVEKLGCRTFASQANFFLIDVGGDGKALYEHLLRQGVIVRPMQAYGYPQYIRITPGRPDENDRFLRSLEQSLKELAYGR